MGLSKEEKDKIEETFKEITTLNAQQNKLYEELLQDLNFEQYEIEDENIETDPEPFLFDAVYNSQSPEDFKEAVSMVEHQIEKLQKKMDE